MPQFAPGESKTAIAPIIVKPAGLSCEVEIFLGPDELTKVATSGRIPFTSTGASQNVRLPIAMPSEGTYHVYIDVYSNGILIGAYQAIEDVVIAPVTEPWVSPTGHLCEGTSEEDDDWAYLTLAYDRNPDSCAKYRRIFSGWSPWVEFTLPATTSSKLKCLLFKRTAPETISKVKIEVYYSGAYHTEYEADFPIEEWFEVSYMQNSVTKVRFSFYNTTSYRAFPHIYEVQVFDDTA